MGEHKSKGTLSAQTPKSAASGIAHLENNILRASLDTLRFNHQTLAVLTWATCRATSEKSKAIRARLCRHVENGSLRRILSRWAFDVEEALDPSSDVTLMIPGRGWPFKMVRTDLGEDAPTPWIIVPQGRWQIYFEPMPQAEDGKQPTDQLIDGMAEAILDMIDQAREVFEDFGD